MSASVLVHCPSCHAEGNLADPALFGKAISCPVCQQVFVAPMPEGQTAAAGVPGAPIDVNVVSPQEVVDADAGSLASTEAVPVSVTALPTDSAAPVPYDAAATTEPADITSASTSETAAAISAEPIAAAIPPSDVTSPAMAFGGASVPPNSAQAMPIAVAIAIPTSPAPQAPVSWPMASAAIPAGYDAPAVTTPPIPVDAGDFLLPERAAMEGPLPAFMAPIAGPGAAETMFAQSLPAPAVRGLVQAPKTPSKTVQMVIIAGVSAILLFATVMFLMGDPMRGQKPKLKKPAEENPIANEDSGPTETMEEMLKRINASSNSGKK